MNDIEDIFVGFCQFGITEYFDGLFDINLVVFNDTNIEQTHVSRILNSNVVITLQGTQCVGAIVVL